MAKIGLAAQLAKQAAQAAREEVAASEADKQGKASAPKAWTVPVLPQDFALDSAVGKAVRQVTGHYRKVLASEGLAVNLESKATAATSDPKTATVVDGKQDTGDFQAVLREKVTGRMVREYTTPALLALFATQQQATGVVVDGQV